MFPFRGLRLSIVLIFLVPLAAPEARAEGSAPAQLAIWNPLQIVESEDSVSGFRYSLLWGVNQEVTGLDLATVAAKTAGDVCGVQAALGFSYIGGDFVGVQPFGLWNQIERKMTGLQVGGLNIAHGGIRGGQVGFLGTDTRGGTMVGVQLSILLGSWATDIRGVQISPVLNKSATGTGLQLAGVYNLGGDLSGASLAGLLNHATGDVTGVQVASFVNVAKKVTGVQFAALVNVAKEVGGVQIGLININKNGFLPVFPLFNFSL